MNTVVSQQPAPLTGTPLPAALRKLYLLRFAFAAVWAALLFTTADSLNLAGRTLLVLYPLFDAACAVVDLRSTRAAGSALTRLYVNIGLSVLTAVALAVALASGIPAVLRVWGVWAVTAGVTQLALGLVRRQWGGQWPMIVSGAISTLAGVSFFLQAGNGAATLRNLAGYAFLGGVFFLVSALRLKPAGRND
ncbi:hypothetical protein [Streptomyces sp. VRA16 Mangrove soil]|uniref:hypothetical protein n=1 Tax=Streptomyces sp. VRA16 Mangrove soil TaxID=2817434 RepID=UPI001A9EB424|nr:hypothetical protein [Streptomyces sp. VRA16 Mangrove soil]MBO1330773.1 hypothetical protein [Streptomyces sp. VRA16 Mangrove soil]